jgi:hypothetical protein
MTNFSVPTIRAKRKSDGLEATINATDFDPAIWEAVDKKAIPAALAAKAEAEQQAAAADANAKALEDHEKARRGAKAAAKKGAGK